MAFSSCHACNSHHLALSSYHCSDGVQHQGPLGQHSASGIRKPPWIPPRPPKPASDVHGSCTTPSLPPTGIPGRPQPTSTTRGGSDPASDTGDGNPSQTSEAPPSPEASNGKRPSSFIKNATQLYKDKRRAKEAARKVDYYQRLYGFVPKNAMTEAEWRDAKERMPKTKVPFKARPGGTSLFELGGAAGGS